MEKRIEKILKGLDTMCPAPLPSLTFKNPFESVVATILSAQCTDVRVNKVTPALFAAAPTPEAMLALGEERLIELIFTTGFYRAKARNLLGMCQMVVEQYNSVIPADLEEMQNLPGVGRKTASVVLSQAFGVPAFPVDRHVLRVTNRLGLAHATTPEKTDLQVRKRIPETLWIKLHLQLIYLGRTLCRPKPYCEKCPLLPFCPDGQKRMGIKAP